MRRDHPQISQMTTDGEWDAWQYRYQTAKDEDERYALLEEAIEECILTEDEVALYLDKSMLT